MSFQSDAFDAIFQKAGCGDFSRSVPAHRSERPVAARDFACQHGVRRTNKMIETLDLPAPP